MAVAAFRTRSATAVLGTTGSAHQVRALPGGGIGALCPCVTTFGVAGSGLGLSFGLPLALCLALWLGFGLGFGLNGALNDAGRPEVKTTRAASVAIKGCCMCNWISGQQVNKCALCAAI